ncbi:MAG TPA: CDP-alcohol phosphatidyltransferase family protein, partial [Polyangiaceae bacterium]|nr:CDP-alcohol phosphatidyltransferase family protein [Polyangiaceae bacterium]
MRMDVRYSARDLLGVPSLLSLVRVPLAASFPFVVHAPWIALCVVAVAAASDVADGWWARHYHQTTPTGAVVDGITDKIFVVVVAISLFVAGKLSPIELA